jgi:hypothetical protein
VTGWGDIQEETSETGDRWAWGEEHYPCPLFQPY